VTDNADWKAKLNGWLANNPKTMPDDLRRPREDFVRRFPKEKLRELTLEQYALGHNRSADSLSYWLEFGTRTLGGMGGGSVGKHGVWWSKKENCWRWNKSFRTDTAEDALAQIKRGLVALVEAVEEGQFDTLDEIGARYLGPSRHSLRSKPLSLYFPDEFLPINKLSHRRRFLHYFGEESNGDLLACNRQLLSKLRSLPEFEGFDPRQMGHFLWTCLLDKPDSDENDEPPDALPAAIERLVDATARTRTVLLYGPPGVGKTWLVNHFATYFLLFHDLSPGKAAEYWQAVLEDDLTRP
jgi:5-methylcytosine-specific restriction protein B